MSAPPSRRVDIAAPAKLNLGLEVLGRRDDGYHDIATIFLAIDLKDRLSLTASAELEMACNVPELAGRENLALSALEALRRAAGIRRGARVELHKHIPLAAGLGGASSDAAAALLAARELWQVPIPDDDLLEIATGLGSDVPFFLRGGCAIGWGRGDVLQPLPAPDSVWFVVVVPRLAIEKKTATLYARLDPADFSNGDRIGAQARRLAAGLPLDPAMLGNAFSGPLYAIAPRLATLATDFGAAGAAAVALSGAGPAHYAPLVDDRIASSVAARLREAHGEDSSIFIARPFPERSPLLRPV